MADFNNPFGNNATKKDGEDKAIEWGDTIAWEDAPEYVVLPPGNYEFTVMNWDRGHYEGNPATGKIACNTARVTVAVETDKGTAYAKYTFYLKKSAIGFVRDFFLCIGLMKKGEAFTPDFDKAIGCKGMAQFDNRPYKGNTYNDVKKWIKP